MLDQAHGNGPVEAGAKNGVVAVDAGGHVAVAIVERIVSHMRANEIDDPRNVAVLAQQVLPATAMIGGMAVGLVVAGGVAQQHILAAPTVARWDEVITLGVAHVVAKIATHRAL